VYDALTTSIQVRVDDFAREEEWNFKRKKSFHHFFSYFKGSTLRMSGFVIAVMENEQSNKWHLKSSKSFIERGKEHNFCCF
jgi:hypothetical protein